MPKTFDCPQCGAPIDENAEDLQHKASVVCKYCGKIIIIPPELRKRRKSQSVAEPKPVGKPWLGCLLVFIFLMVAVGVGISIATTVMTGSMVAAIDEIVTGRTATVRPTATDVVSAVETQVAPLIKAATEAAETIETKIPRATPTRGCEKIQ